MNTPGLADISQPLFAEMWEFVQHAEHDAGCNGGYPYYRCKCGVRRLRLRMGVMAEPYWDDAHEQPTE